MKYFTSILFAFWFLTFILWKFTALLDANYKGWFAVLLFFFGLIQVQRSDVRKEREQEHADRIKAIEAYQDALHKLRSTNSSSGGDERNGPSVQKEE